MPIRKPAQHNIEHPPGCITPEQMLANKQADEFRNSTPKKLTFEEYWRDTMHSGAHMKAWLKECWKAAQENK